MDKSMPALSVRAILTSLSVGVGLLTVSNIQSRQHVCTRKEKTGNCQQKWPQDLATYKVVNNDWE